MTTFKSTDAIGNREDLSDEIYMLDVDKTPLMSYAGTSKATATLHEWQSDDLGDGAGDNAHIEGADFQSGTASPTERLQNRCQISKKEIKISGTQEVVEKAGRGSEMDYQTAKQLRQLKMDMEKVLCANQAPVVGNGSTAANMRSIESWYESNVSRASDGVNGSASAAATDGTQRAFTEDLLKDVLQSAYENGGDPNLVIAGPYNKRVLSGFAGNSTDRVIENKDQKLVTSVEVYVSDFGELKIVPSRYVRPRTVHVIDTDHVAVAYLRPVISEPLAKTGDSERKQVITEYTLEMRNEAASGVVADLETATS